MLLFNYVYAVTNWSVCEDAVLNDVELGAFHKALDKISLLKLKISESLHTAVCGTQTNLPFHTINDQIQVLEQWSYINGIWVKLW